MPTLREIYQTLSQDSFKAGVVEAFYQRGLSEIMAEQEWRGHKGDSHRYEIQKSLPHGSAARDPMSNQPGPNSIGTRHDVRIYLGQMLFDFDVPRHVQKVMSETNDPTAIRAEESAHTFYLQWMQQMFHGDGSYQLRTSGANTSISGNNMNGKDFYRAQYCGMFIGGDANTDPTFTIGQAGAGQWYNERFRDLKRFATTGGVPTHDETLWQTLSYDIVDAAIMQIRGRKEGITIYSSPRAWLRFLKSLRASGGETSQMHIGQEKVLVPSYDGKPWIISDDLGAPKLSVTYDSDGNITGGGGQIEAGSLDVLTITGDFIGFDDSDVGARIKVDGADFATGRGAITTDPRTGETLAADETLIVAYLGNRQVQLLDAAAGAVADAFVRRDQIEVLYVCRQRGERNSAVLYASGAEASEDTYSAETSDYWGTIGGLEVVSLGQLQAGGSYNRYRMTWDGQFTVDDPQNDVRVTHFLTR